MLLAVQVSCLYRVLLGGWGLSCSVRRPMYFLPVMWEPTSCPEASIPSSCPHSTTTSPGLHHVTPFLLAAACPAGQVFVNCSELHPDPELSRERTCEQQLLNLSMPARSPCLSGCACPQGYVPTLPGTLLPKGWQIQEVQVKGGDDLTQPGMEETAWP